MNVLKTSILASLLLIFGAHSVFASEVSGKALVYVNIQFPTVEKVPCMRAYYCGIRVTKSEYNNTANKITFTIPAWQQTSFNLVITEWYVPQTEMSEENTVKFLKIPEGVAYRSYTLTLVKAAHVTDPHANEHATQNLTWHIQENKGLPGRHIPDDALIIVYNPDYIEKIEGGNASELPTIFIKPTILELLGSEEKLHEYSDSLLLAALNLDSLHASLQQQVKHVDKTVIALTSI